MTIQEVTAEPMYALFAPDGNWQAMSLAPDFASCVAVIRMLHKAKLSKSFHELSMKGYKVLPVQVTLVVTGDENTAFTKS
jgi:hypothetical protein